MKNLYFKALIISVLCLSLNSCKSQSKVTKKERTDTTDDVRNEQMDDYEDELKQQYEENNHY